MGSMINAVLIFFGAGTGGLIRFWVSNVCYWLLGNRFPYGTIIVNISGSFLMGLLFALLLERIDGANHALRALLLIGFLGGYTTFSSFSIETYFLLESGKWLSAILNILLSVALCITGVWLGINAAKQLTPTIGNTTSSALDTPTND
jgi:fluoride exporter